MESNNINKVNTNKMIISLLIFLVIGLLVNTAFNYIDAYTAHNRTEQRAVVGDEILELNRTQSAQIKILLEKVTILENKIDNISQQQK